MKPGRDARQHRSNGATALLDFNITDPHFCRCCCYYQCCALWCSSHNCGNNSNGRIDTTFSGSALSYIDESIKKPITNPFCLFFWTPPNSNQCVSTPPLLRRPSSRFCSNRMDGLWSVEVWSVTDIVIPVTTCRLSAVQQKHMYYAYASYIDSYTRVLTTVVCVRVDLLFVFVSGRKFTKTSACCYKYLSQS